MFSRMYSGKWLLNIFRVISVLLFIFSIAKPLSLYWSIVELKYVLILVHFKTLVAIFKAQ
jgi:hypothetical protein